MKQFFTVCLLTFSFAAAARVAGAQPALAADYSFVMDIPRVVTMASSPAHFYVLSESEGMAVFRARPDSLEWLYSSTGMQRRGSKIVADIRFAYLFGDSNRLTVLEPTSVMGVYSSAQLPAPPLDVKRMEQDLYIALGSEGLAKLSLESSQPTDANADPVELPELINAELISLEGTGNRLFALTAESKLLRFDYNGSKLSLSQSSKLSEKLSDLFLVRNTLYGTDKRGRIFEIEGGGTVSQQGNIGEPVTKIVQWRDLLVIRGTSNRLWTSYQNQKPTLWKKDREAGNHITVSKNQLWISEYGQITKVQSQRPTEKEQQTGYPAPVTKGSISLEKIQDYTLPHSESLLFPIKFKTDLPAEQIQFTYQSPDIQDAVVRGQSFYWNPTSRDVGTHRVKITASAAGGQSSSASFSIHVRSFNAPPRFTPVRQVTIPVGESFTLPVSAVDPDGINKNLIRYIGVNLPKGASVDESTGTVTWTPTARQTGKNTFRIIATDQYGAASSVDVTINVSDSVKRGNPDK